MIDLYSDTQTRPVPGMRAAMAAAEVGDEQIGEDPTTTRLCTRVATLLGKEAAVFLPSGTMCNVIGMAAACGPGQTILTSAHAHVIGSEAGGLSAVAGCFPRIIPCQRGIFDAEVLSVSSAPKAKRNVPRAGMVWIEQTVNRGGGAVWPLATLAQVGAVAMERGLHIHMDGARLFNAAAALGVEPAAVAEVAHSVWVDLSKGLGCPVGAVLAGSADFIERAWIWKHRLGGAMRQSGVLAAAGLYALDHHLGRAAEDNANAARLAEGVRTLPAYGLFYEPVESNLVFIDLSHTGLNSEEALCRLRDRGVRMGVDGPMSLRAVTHLHVTAEQVETAVAALRDILP